MSQSAITTAAAPPEGGASPLRIVTKQPLFDVVRRSLRNPRSLLALSWRRTVARFVVRFAFRKKKRRRKKIIPLNRRDKCKPERQTRRMRRFAAPFLRIRQRDAFRKPRPADSKLRAATRNLARYNLRRRRFHEATNFVKGVRAAFRSAGPSDSYAFIPQMEHACYLTQMLFNICILFILPRFRPAIVVSDRFTVKILRVGFFGATPVI